MRKLIAVLLLCLVPTLAVAQSPSITITPPKIETSGITVKHVVVVAGAIVAGAVLGEAIFGSLVGDALGTLAGAAVGYVVGSSVAEELEDDPI